MCIMSNVDRWNFSWSSQPLQKAIYKALAFCREIFCNFSYLHTSVLPCTFWKRKEIVWVKHTRKHKDMGVWGVGCRPINKFPLLFTQNSLICYSTITFGLNQLFWTNYIKTSNVSEQSFCDIFNLSPG